MERHSRSRHGRSMWHSLTTLGLWGYISKDQSSLTLALLVVQWYFSPLKISQVLTLLSRAGFSTRPFHTQNHFRVTQKGSLPKTIAAFPGSVI